MIPEIITLAKKVDQAWKRQSYQDKVFHKIACQYLSGSLIMDFLTITNKMSENSILPKQHRADQSFGQPAITLYYDDRFMIEALCWHSGTPAIHQHSFNGAFRVISGQSVHSQYTFTATDQIDEIAIGHLQLESLSILDVGMTCEIPFGASLIHSVFHLGNPSMTLVVRTHGNGDPELCYLPPGIAYDPSARSSGINKRLQLLDTLNTTGHATYVEFACSVIKNTDLYDGMAIVMRAGAHSIDESVFQGFNRLLREIHGPRIDILVNALYEERRRCSLIRLRAAITDPDTRFFLACLLSFAHPEDFLKAMAQRYGDQASALLAISNGVSIVFSEDEGKQIIFREATMALLENVPEDSFLLRVKSLLNREISMEEVNKLKRFYRQLKSHSLLTSIFGRKRYEKL